MLGFIKKLLGIAKDGTVIASTPDRIVRCGSTTRINLDQWLRVQEERLHLKVISTEEMESFRHRADICFEAGVVDLRYLYTI